MWHGIDLDDWCAYFGARNIVPIRQQRTPYWRTNHAAKQIYFSTFHLSNKTVRKYVKQLRTLNIRWLHGFPSTIGILAALMLDCNLAVDTVELVTVGGEALPEKTKETIEIAFGCPVRQHYGLREGVVNISECEKGSLHIDEDFSLVELIRSGDSENQYRLIGTNFYNPLFPLIRYDTGDLCSGLAENCTCGRSSRVVYRLDGRLNDVLVMPSGAKIGYLASLFREERCVLASQIIQKSLDQIEVLVVPGESFGAQESDKIKKIVETRVEDSVRVNVTPVRVIPATKGGKRPAVVSLL
jgi:phenylacetate-CoA ligase